MATLVGRPKKAALWLGFGFAGLSLLAYTTYHLSRSRTFQLFGKIVHRVETSAPVVALTFDDGPRPQGTEQVLDMLRNHRVRATFFLTGREIEAHPESARAIAIAGHEIGNHSYSHARMVFKPLDFVRRELDAVECRNAYRGLLPWLVKHRTRLAGVHL